MHLQVPGLRATRDQNARIATGACCAVCGGTAGGRIAGESAMRRRFAMVRVSAGPMRTSSKLGVRLGGVGAAQGGCLVVLTRARRGSGDFPKKYRVTEASSGEI
jgi:hypothetical protein